MTTFTLQKDSNNVPFVGNLDSNNNVAVPTEQYIKVNGIYLPVSSTNPLPASLTGSNMTLANNVTATGAQNGQSVGSAYSLLRLNVWATGTSPTFDVQVQGQMYDGQWYTINASNSATGASVGTDVTTAGVYDFDISSWQQVRLNVVSLSGTNVSIFAQGGLHQ